MAVTSWLKTPGLGRPAVVQEWIRDEALTIGRVIVRYLDHAAPVNGKTAGDKVINRALRSIDGSVVEIKEKAFAALSA